jgi:putative transposase
MAENKPHGRKLRRGRVSEPGRIYLVTTVTHERRPLFADFHCARALVHCLRHMAHTGHAETVCFVVMPDHLHWSLNLGERRGLSGLVQAIKSYSARRINSLRGEAGPVWQAGFHAHALRGEEDVVGLARYVVANPVRAGLVEQVGAYPFWDAKWL